MANVEVFARKASGLTREAGMLDTTYFAIMNNAVPVSIWFVIGAYSWLPGANLTLACMITLFFVCFGFAMVWGMLGGSMPRSGGSYVYNSRIIHPIIGLGVSFCNGGFVMIAWIWVLAPWIGEVGLPIMAGCLGIDPASVEWATSGIGLYLVSTVVNLSAFFVSLAGMRMFFTVQKVFVTWSLLGTIIAGVIITSTSHESFVALWNNYAAEMGSLDFNAVIQGASAEMGGIPETWNWSSTLGLLLPVTWVAIYGYIIAFIGGEVKSPRKNIFRANILNVVVCIFFLMWVGLAYEKLLGWEGLHAFSWLQEEGLEGYAFPFDATYIGVASMIVGFNKILGFIMAGAFIVADWLWITFSYIAFSRAAFAWGMDGLGPKWFTDISPKYNQPAKLLVTVLILSQIALTQYAWNPEVLGSISVEVLQLISVFGFTAISLMIFPYVKKSKHIWDASPYKDWKIAGIPIATISGFVALAYVFILVYSYYIQEAFAFMHTYWTAIYIIVWGAAIIWYFAFKQIRMKEGIDITLAFKEIPPE
jgi:APA family basic amino acid/polyamine antiporter